MHCRSARSTASILGFLLFVPFVVSCGGGGDKSASAWTVGEGALTLTETLRAGDDESYFFGSIDGMAVRADGRIYVADRKESDVKVLAPDGTLEGTIGHSGLGPGEFRFPSDVVLARGDSLYVLDGDYRGQLSVFTPSHEFAYRMSLRAEGGAFSGRPIGLLHVSEELGSKKFGYLVEYSSPPHPEKGLRDYAVRRVSPGGTPGDTLFTYPPAEQYVKQTDTGLSIAQIPFSDHPELAGGPKGNVHYAWSDSLGVQVYGPGGELRRTIDIPYEPVPVTETERERKLSKGDKEWRETVKNKIPETKPAFTQFLVDDQGRYWFGRPTANPDSTAWWVAWPEKKQVVTTTLPSEVELMTVQDDRAYGRATTEEGAPALVRYRIRNPSN